MLTVCEKQTLFLMSNYECNKPINELPIHLPQYNALYIILYNTLFTISVLLYKFRLVIP